MGMQNTNNRASVDISFTDDSKESFNLVAKVAVLTLKKIDDKWQFHSTHGYLYSPGKSNKNHLKSSEDGTLKGSFATITFKDKNAVIKFDCNNSNLIRYNSNKDQQIFSCYASGQQDVQIYKKQNSNLTPTNTTFGTDYDGKTFNFVDGKLEGWNAPAAKQTLAGADGNISYASDNQDVATVDGNGQLTFKGYGTAKITATFTPNDEGKYAKSGASYTVINKEGVRTPTAITFGEGVDNNTFEVKDGETFESKVATVTPVDATGSVEYNSSDEAIAKVDATTGAITLGAKYGTAKITARFDATGSFANSEASYSIKHVGDFVFYESFDKCDGKGGNDGSFNGTGNDKVDYDNIDGWKSTSANGACKCVKIGSGSSAGSVTTPSIAVSTTCRLSFKAAAWAGDNSTISVTISSGKLTYNNGEPTQTITIKPNDKEWTDYSMIVSGANPFTVKFACSGKDNRFFLDEVMVTKVAPQEITLDENSDNIVEAAENVNVTLKRTFYKDGEWNTLCLPFAVADAKTAFDNAELREVDTKNSHDNTIFFKEATAIEAGKPYLIKWANSSAAAVNVEKKFEGVTLVAATPVVVKEGGISFNGFYKMTQASELGASVAAIGAGNKLFKVTEGKMKGFRAAFVLASGAEATKYKVVIDGTATGIEDLVIDGVKANGRVYNLNGQYVGNSLNGLQPGLYIQNGKKIVVKQLTSKYIYDYEAKIYYAQSRADRSKSQCHPRRL